MKLRARVLSALLCLALLMSAAPRHAWMGAAEEASEFPAEAAPAEAPEEVEAAEAADARGDIPLPDEFEEQSADPLPEVEEAPAPAEEFVPVAEPAPDAADNRIDYEADASASPTFAQGYAEILADGAAVYESAAVGARVRARLNRGVVYVTERSDARPDRLRACFNAGPDRGMVEGWLDANCLRPMEPEAEVPAYQERCARLEGVLFARNQLALPLAPIDCADAEEAEKQTEVAIEEAPELAESADDSISEQEHPIVLLLTPEDAELATEVDEDAELATGVDEEAEVPRAAGAEAAVDDGDAASPAELPRIELTAEKLTLGVDEVRDLRELVTGEFEGASLRFAAEAGCVDVSADGVLVALRPGDAEIAIEAVAGEDVVAAANLSVEVRAAATGVSIPGSLRLSVGMSARLTPAFTPANGYFNHRFSSDDEAVASVTPEGELTALAPGEATVTVETDNGLADTCAVTVQAAPAQVVLEQPAIRLTEGETGQIAAHAVDAEGAPVTCELEYVADADAQQIVRVAPDGEVTALQQGSAQVTVQVKSAPSVQASCAIEVSKKAARIDLERDEITLGVKDTFQLGEGPGGLIRPEDGGVASFGYAVYKDAKCKTKSSAVASVSASGLITAKAKGTAYVKITPDGDAAKAAVLTVTVKKAATSVSFSAGELILAPLASGTLTVNFPSGTAADYSIASSDVEENYVRVERVGNTNKWALTAQEVFDAPVVTLTVKSRRNAYTDSCAVRVLPGPTEDEIEIASAKSTLGVGETGGKVSASVASDSFAPGGFTYASDNADALRVDPDTGELTALQACEEPVTITATATVPHAAGAYASKSVRVEVVEKPTEFTLNAATLYLGVKDTYSLSADPDGLLRVAPAGARANVSYRASKTRGKSDKTAALSVSSAGLITAKAKGTAYVRITPKGTGLNPLDLKVVVSKATGSIALSASAKTIGLGMKGETLTVKFSSSAFGDYAVESSAPDVLRVTKKYKTIALEPSNTGSATVTVRSTNKGYVDSCRVTVLPAPGADAIELSVPDAIGVGEAGRKAAASYDEDRYRGEIRFASDAPDVLTVNATTGALTAKAEGAADISVLVDGEAVARRSVAVAPQPTSMTLEPQTITIEKGQSYAIDPGEIVKLSPADARASYRYTASAKSDKIASTSCIQVSAAGAITAKKAGTAYVRILSQNASCFAYLKVTVAEKGTTFKLAPLSIKLGAGMAAKLSPSNAPEGEISYACAPEGIVEVDPDGTVRALKAGAAKVTARVGEEATAVPVTVTVLPAPTGEQIRFSEDSTARISARQKNARVSASCDAGTMAELIYEIEGATPEDVELNEATGALSYAGAATEGSFQIVARDKNNGVESEAFTVRIVPAASIRRLSPSTIQLGKGETFRISDGPGGIIQLSDGSAEEEAKFSSGYSYAVYSNSAMTKRSAAVASVSAAGVITAKKAGTAYVKITNQFDNGYKKLTVKVSALPASVTLSPATLTLGAHMEGTLKVKFPSGKYASYGFASGDEKIATVDESGRVTAMGVGSTAITVTTSNGKADIVPVRVLPAPTAIAMAPAAGLTIGMNQKGAKLSAAPDPDDGTTMAAFAYESNDAGIVRVDADTGALTPVAPGTAKITATAKGSVGVRCSVDVTVLAAPAKIQLKASSIKLGVGDSYQLAEYDAADNPGGVIQLTPPEGADEVCASYSYGVYADKKFKSKSGVVSVSASGKITAKKKGTAYVKIATQNSKIYATLKVQVYKLAASATLSPSELELGVGMSRKLTVSFPSKTSAAYAISSSNEAVAKVDPLTNAVTARSEGEATLTLRTQNGKVDSCRVKVLPATKAIHWEFAPGAGSRIQTDGDGRYVLGVDEKGARILATPDAGALASFSFESSAPSVLAVGGATGALTPKKAGTADITVRVAYDAQVEAVTVPVRIVARPKAANISLRQNAIYLGASAAYKDSYAIEEYDAVANPNGLIELSGDFSASYTYKLTSGGAYASVSADGVITAKKAGTAKLRIYTQNASVYEDLRVVVSDYPAGVRLTPALRLGSGMSTTLTPTLSAGGFGRMDARCDDPDLRLAFDGTGKALTLTAGEIRKKKRVTLTVSLRESGASDSCQVTLLPAPGAEGIEIDYGAMTRVEEDEAGKYLRVGVKEKGVRIVAKCASADAMSDYTYEVIAGADGGLTVADDGELSATAEGEYTVRVRSASNSDATADCRVVAVEAPTGITLSTSAIQLGVGDVYQIAERREDAETGEESGIIRLTPAGASASYSYGVYSDKNCTSKSGAVSVSADGRITAKTKGKTAYVKIATQSATKSKGFAVLSVQVLAAATSFTLSPSTQEIGELSSGKLAPAFPKSSAGLIKRYMSSREDLLQIRADGSFTVAKLADGETPEAVTVRAFTQSGLSASATVTVLPHPTRVAFAAPEGGYELSAGMSLATAVELPEGTMAQRFRYASDSDAVAKIDESGVLTGVAEGETTIRVTANPGVEGYECSSEAIAVRVVDAPVRASYDETLGAGVLKIAVGDVIPIPVPRAYNANDEAVPANFTYASSASSYVRITGAGDRMQGVKSGKTVTITAAPHSGASASFQVRAYDSKPSAVTLAFDGWGSVNGKTIPMYINESHPEDRIRLRAELTGTNINYGSVTFASSDEGVATVDAQGVVTAHDKGSATITATANVGGKSASCTVEVGELCARAELVSKEFTLMTGEADEIELRFDPEGSGMRVSYRSENPDVAAVGLTGAITGVAGGDAIVRTIGQYEDLLADGDANVKVLYDPERIALESPVAKLYMALGEELTLAPVLTRGELPAGDVNAYTTARSSDDGVVAIAPQPDSYDKRAGAPARYTVHAVAEGSATVTIESWNHLELRCEIAVGPEGSSPASRFEWEAGRTLVLVKGDTAEIAYGLSTAAYLAQNYEIVDDSACLTVDEDMRAITGAKAGAAKLQLRLGEDVADEVQIRVIEHVKPVLTIDGAPVSGEAELRNANYTASGAQHEIAVLPVGTNYGKNPLLLGTPAQVAVANESILRFDPEKMLLSSRNARGTTNVTVSNFDSSVTVSVTVRRRMYRALLISEYNGVGGGSVLPFAQYNIDWMKQTLGKTSIYGESYKVTTKRNPNYAGVKSAIKSAFADTNADDVSLVYVVAHGHENGKKGYKFSGADGTMVTDTNLMTWIHNYIKGKVVLLLDTCHSGGFIDNQSSNLKKYGNIAVLAAQEQPRPAAYYVNYKGIITYEFFTRALCTALENPRSVGSKDPWGNKKPTADANGNDLFTISELFTKTKSTTIAMVNAYVGTGAISTTWWNKGKGGVMVGGISANTDKMKAWWKNGREVPQYYIPDGMKNLSICGKRS